MREIQVGDFVLLSGKDTDVYYLITKITPTGNMNISPLNNLSQEYYLSSSPSNEWLLYIRLPRGALKLVSKFANVTFIARENMPQLIFTNIPDIDSKILSELDDFSLSQACSVNSYINSLCSKDSFWINRIQKFYPDLPMIFWSTGETVYDVIKKYYPDISLEQIDYPENLESLSRESVREEWTVEKFNWKAYYFNLEDNPFVQFHRYVIALINNDQEYLDSWKDFFDLHKQLESRDFFARSEISLLNKEGDICTLDIRVSMNNEFGDYRQIWVGQITYNVKTGEIYGIIKELIDYDITSADSLIEATFNLHRVALEWTKSQDNKIALFDWR